MNFQPPVFMQLKYVFIFSKISFQLDYKYVFIMPKCKAMWLYQNAWVYAIIHIFFFLDCEPNHMASALRPTIFFWIFFLFCRDFMARRIIGMPRRDGTKSRVAGREISGYLLCRLELYAWSVSRGKSWQQTQSISVRCILKVAADNGWINVIRVSRLKNALQGARSLSFLTFAFLPWPQPSGIFLFSKMQIFIWSSTNAEHSDPLSKRKKKKKKSLLVQSFCTRALWATLHLIKLFRVIFSLFNTYIRQVSLWRKQTNQIDPQILGVPKSEKVPFNFSHGKRHQTFQQQFVIHLLSLRCPTVFITLSPFSGLVWTYWNSTLGTSIIAIATIRPLCAVSVISCKQSPGFSASDAIKRHCMKLRSPKKKKKKSQTNDFEQVWLCSAPTTTPAPLVGSVFFFFSRLVGAPCPACRGDDNLLNLGRLACECGRRAWGR